jgi:RNA polymerase sigma-70 factor, ECF subfamily
MCGTLTVCYDDVNCELTMAVRGQPGRIVLRDSYQLPAMLSAADSGDGLRRAHAHAGSKNSRSSGGGPDARTDAELIRQLHVPAGDAIEILLRRYRRLVYRVAVNILRDATEAEDVAQDVFFEIYTKAHLYDASRGSVKVWLLQYAYHRSLRRKLALRRCAAYRECALDSFQPVPVRRFLGLTRQECRWLIRASLAQLPVRQKATLILVCFEGLNLRDVADRLGVSLGCARHYYYRGLTNLRKWRQESRDFPPARQPHTR